MKTALRFNMLPLVALLFALTPSCGEDEPSRPIPMTDFGGFPDNDTGGDVGTDMSDSSTTADASDMDDTFGFMHGTWRLERESDNEHLATLELTHFSGQEEVNGQCTLTFTNNCNLDPGTWTANQLNSLELSFRLENGVTPENLNINNGTPVNGAPARTLSVRFVRSDTVETADGLLIRQ